MESTHLLSHYRLHTPALTPLIPHTCSHSTDSCAPGLTPLIPHTCSRSPDSAHLLLLYWFSTPAFTPLISHTCFHSPAYTHLLSFYWVHSLTCNPTPSKYTPAPHCEVATLFPWLSSVLFVGIWSLIPCILSLSFVSWETLFLYLSFLVSC